MPKIMVVDDEPSTADLVAAVLKKEGHAVRTAANGAACLAALTSETPDLIIMDVAMPEMDGYTLVSHLAADGATRDIPVIVVSGKDSMRDTFRLFTNVVDFFNKPFDVKQLRDRVQEILSRGGSR